MTAHCSRLHKVQLDYVSNPRSIFEIISTEARSTPVQYPSSYLAVGAGVDDRRCVKYLPSYLLRASLVDPVFGRHSITVVWGESLGTWSIACTSGLTTLKSESTATKTELTGTLSELIRTPSQSSDSEYSESTATRNDNKGTLLLLLWWLFSRGNNKA